MAGSALRRVALLTAAIAAAAPIGTAFAFTIYMTLADALLTNGRAAFPDWRAIVKFGGGYGLIVGVPLTASLGLATHAVLSGRRWRHVSTYALSGAAVGTLVGSVYGCAENSIDGLWLAIPGALTGACIAACFWLIRRPDHIASPTQSNTTP